MNVITKGSLVESKQDNKQGIVTGVFPDLKSTGYGAYLRAVAQTEGQPITDDQAMNQEWATVSNFGEWQFTVPVVDLVIIPIGKVRFEEYPCAFYGTILSVQQVGHLCNLMVRTNPSYTSACQGYSNQFRIWNPTVTPYVGDIICGTQLMAVIQADGLNYPYKHLLGELRKDW